jgi:hypothetical protein
MEEMYAQGVELFLKEYKTKKKGGCAQLVPPVVFVTHKYMML